ncbi:MAG: hypothetical protein JWP82_980 [Humibacillus sp.]|nr:hypothetical protein [Humibacillus sp.]
MKTMTTRAIALTSALAISLGAAACSKSETPATSTGGASTSAGATGAPGAGGATGSATSSPADATPTTSATSEDSGSSSSPSASEVLEKAKTNALAATSGAFSGNVEDNGKKTTIDFKGTSDGKTADITISMAGDGKARVISVPDGIYIQGDETFWKKQNAPAKVIAAKDKFIKAPASASSMTQSLSLKSFLDKAFGAVTPNQVSKDLGEENVNGVDCWVITDTKGKDEGALYVSKDAYEVVRFTGSTKSPGQLDFSKWNDDLGIKAPAAGDVLSIS